MDDRKLKILAAVVNEYIVTGEPVGSKTIASMPDIRVSPATIRNDMAMLEQLGYLEQPHTSAGRIPTYKGKRMYVLLMITSSGSIQNKMCRLEFDLTNEQLQFFNNYMTENLSGVSIDSLSDETIEKLAEAMGTYAVTLTPLMNGIRSLQRALCRTTFM